MGKSLKEYIATLGYWGLLVIIPITLDILGVYQIVSNTKVLNIPSWIWFQIALALTLIIPFIAFHKLRLRLSTLLDTLPSIETEVQCDMLYGLYIDVKNNGAEANFKAQVEILDSNGLDPRIGISPNWRRFIGLWEGKLTESIPLMRGESQRIKLVSFEQRNLAGWLRLYKVNSTPNISSELYIDTHSYPIGQQGYVIPGFHFKVTITSHPSTKKGPKILECKVRANGDFKLIESDLNKGDFQT